MVCAHDGELLSLTKEGNSATTQIKLEAMVPVTQGQILHDSTSVRSLEGSESRVADARGGGRGEQGFLFNGDSFCLQ